MANDSWLSLALRTGWGIFTGRQLSTFSISPRLFGEPSGLHTVYTDVVLVAVFIQAHKILFDSPRGKG
jgi:predicted PurR-regulated permease PerM